MAQDTGGMSTVQQTNDDSVLCCKCDIVMQPNAANKCATCLRREFNITKDLETNALIARCSECKKILQARRKWVVAEPESKELLSLCVKGLKNLHTVKLIHAEFISTQSKRFHVKLLCQKEVLHGVIVEQVHVVHYAVLDKLCEACCSRMHPGAVLRTDTIEENIRLLRDALNSS